MFGGEDVGVASLEGKIMLTFYNIYHLLLLTTSRKPLLLSLSELDSVLCVHIVPYVPHSFLATLFFFF